MRKIFFLLCAPVLLLAACTKKEVVVNGPLQNPPYRVSGLSDITFNRSPFSRSSEQRLSLNFIYESGTPKRLALDVTNLPAGLTHSFSIQKGYPDFSSRLSIRDGGVASGSYNAQLVVKSEDDFVTRNLPFTITVNGGISCAEYFAGKTFAVSQNCSGTNQTYEVSITRQSLANDTLLLNNFLGTGQPLKAFFDCQSRSFKAPSQAAGNKIYTASGSIQEASGAFKDRIIFYYTETTFGGGTTNCQFEMIAK